MENEEMNEELTEQPAPKIERVTLADIEHEEQEEFGEQVVDAFQKVIEAYQNLTPEEKEQVKEYLKNR